MKTRDNQVSIVIPNYNGMKFIDTCLQAVLASEGIGTEVIVVDNGSTDGSRAYIEAHYPQVILLALDKNYGFSRAVNEGIRASQSAYVILLNNDTEVEQDFVLQLWKAIEKEKQVFSCGAKMLQFQNRELLDDAGDLYCALGWAFARGKGRPETLFDTGEEIFAACAGAAIYRREVFEEIGYFDEKHFAYLEDIDVAYRARLFGYRNRYVPEARVYHMGSGTSGSRHNAFKVRLSSRNSIYLVYKNMPLWQIVLNIPFLAAGFFAKYLFFVKKGLGKEYRQGIRQGFAMCSPTDRVDFKRLRFGSCFRLQMELWKNTWKRFR